MTCLSWGFISPERENLLLTRYLLINRVLQRLTTRDLLLFRKHGLSLPDLITHLLSKQIYLEIVLLAKD